MVLLFITIVLLFSVTIGLVVNTASKIFTKI